MTLLAGEGRVSDHVGIQVATHDAFDEAGALDVLGTAVRQLNPIIHQVVCYPVDESVDAEAAGLDTGVSLEFGLGGELA